MMGVRWVGDSFCWVGVVNSNSNSNSNVLFRIIHIGPKVLSYW
jgi:hypothetical protein